MATSSVMRSVGNTGDCAVVLNVDTGAVLAEVLTNCNCTDFCSLLFQLDQHSFPPGGGGESPGRVVCCCSSHQAVHPAWQQWRKWTHLDIHLPLSVRVLHQHHISLNVVISRVKAKPKRACHFVLDLERGSIVFVNQQET